MQENIRQAIAALKSGLVGEQTVAASLPFADQPVMTDLGNGLLVVYQMPIGDDLVYVQQHHLQSSGLTQSELHQIAIANLTAREGVEAKLKQFGAIYGLFLDDVFVASLLLRDDFWDEELVDLAPNGFVAALPSRDTLAVCDAASTEGIQSLKMMVERAFSCGKQHLISPHLYLRKNGKWEPLL